MDSKIIIQFQERTKDVLEKLVNEALRKGYSQNELCAYAWGRTGDERLLCAVRPFRDLHLFPPQIAAVHLSCYPERPPNTVGVVYAFDLDFVYGLLFTVTLEGNAPPPAQCSTIDTTPTPHEVNMAMVEFQNSTHEQLSEFIVSRCLALGRDPLDYGWVVDGNDDEPCISMFHPKSRLWDYLRKSRMDGVDELCDLLERKPPSGTVVVLYLLDDWAVAHVTLPAAYSPGGSA